MRSVLLAAVALSSPLISAHAIHKKRSSVEPYAPFTTSCPTGSLIRSADTLNSDEKAYVEGRSTVASEALLEWLGQAWGCYTAELRDLPTLAIALSGGGPKAGLTSAGTLYAFDARESDSSVAGILQATTYISALSGGTLTLSGIMANDFALISTLKKEFYDVTYQNTFQPALDHITQIEYDVGNKTAAGYTATLLDIYGRIISFDFFGESPDGGNGFLWSNVTLQPSFQNYSAPYPILTATESDVASGQCTATNSSAIWEMSPLDFGSWDSSVDAFYPMQYLGTASNSTSGACTAGFDNTGFLTAISSNILVNATACSTGNYSLSSLNSLALPIDEGWPSGELVNPYGIIPNPFYQSSEAGSINTQQNLYLADGGYSGQIIPIFPWIQTERDVDVVILVDTETESSTNITDGSSVYNTYLSAQAKGLSKMPIVPTPAQFAAQNLSAQPQFYGCYDTDKTTMIFLPNTEETIDSGYEYTAAQVSFIFTGGYDQATAANSTEWAGCLACGIMHKTPWELPEQCDACLEKYCWTG